MLGHDMTHLLLNQRRGGPLRLLMSLPSLEKSSCYYLSGSSGFPAVSDTAECEVPWRHLSVFGTLVSVPSSAYSFDLLCLSVSARLDSVAIVACSADAASYFVTEIYVFSCLSQERSAALSHLTTSHLHEFAEQS